MHIAMQRGVVDHHSAEMLASNHHDFSFGAAKKINTCVRRDLECSLVLRAANARDDAPTFFDREELVLGNMLGSGGFADIYEIEEIHCQHHRGYTRSDENRRIQMAQETRRKIKGKSPYVAKVMRPKFLGDTDKFVDAGYGLVMEAHFLAAIQHPHILSIHGWASEGPMAFCDGHDGYFLILDRLKGTLDQRILEWSKQMSQYKAAVLARIGDSGMTDLLLPSLFSGRLKVARDVASALAYMHLNGIIYRDLKPSNIGFDMRGTVKLFDLGLARELPPQRDMEEEFHMSAQVGTPRYMSPEVGFSEAYNEKADVYSFSLVVWEMLALVRPFGEMSTRVHRNLVLELGQRPELDPTWPDGIKNLLRLSWDVNPQVRPGMSYVHRVLENHAQKLKMTRSRTQRFSITRRGSDQGLHNPNMNRMRKNQSLLTPAVNSSNSPSSQNATWGLPTNKSPNSYHHHYAVSAGGRNTSSYCRSLASSSKSPSSSPKTSSWTTATTTTSPPQQPRSRSSSSSRRSAAVQNASWGLPTQSKSVENTSWGPNQQVTTTRTHPSSPIYTMLQDSGGSSPTLAAANHHHRRHQDNAFGQAAAAATAKSIGMSRGPLQQSPTLTRSQTFASASLAHGNKSLWLSS